MPHRVVGWEVEWGPFGVATYAVACEFRFWEGCGDGARVGGARRFDYRGRREGRLCASSCVRRGPVVLSIFSEGAHGIKLPPSPSGHEDRGGAPQWHKVASFAFASLG